MARYQTEKNWEQVYHLGRYAIEQCDLLDTRTNTTYRGGARRVTRDGKPVRGRGGTVPFKGEMAWTQADCLLDQLLHEDRLASFDN